MNFSFKFKDFMKVNRLSGTIQATYYRSKLKNLIVYSDQVSDDHNYRLNSIETRFGKYDVLKVKLAPQGSLFSNFAFVKTEIGWFLICANLENVTVVNYDYPAKAFRHFMDDRCAIQLMENDQWLIFSLGRQSDPFDHEDNFMVLRISEPVTDVRMTANGINPNFYCIKKDDKWALITHIKYPVNEFVPDINYYETVNFISNSRPTELGTYLIYVLKLRGMVSARYQDLYICDNDIYDINARILLRGFSINLDLSSYRIIYLNETQIGDTESEALVPDNWTTYVSFSDDTKIHRLYLLDLEIRNPLIIRARGFVTTDMRRFLYSTLDDKRAFFSYPKDGEVNYIKGEFADAQPFLPAAKWTQVSIPVSKAEELFLLTEEDRHFKYFIHILYEDGHVTEKLDEDYLETLK